MIDPNHHNHPLSPAGYETHLHEVHGQPGAQLVRPAEWALAFGNAVFSVPEFAVAAARQAGVAAMDSLHNWFDFLGYRNQLHLIALSAPESQEIMSTDSRFAWWSTAKKWLTQSGSSNEAKLEKSSFAFISLPAIGALAFAGAGIARELTGSQDEGGIGLADIAHFGAAGAALALAGGLMRTGKRMTRVVDAIDNPNPNLVRHTNNFYAHAKLDAASSGAAVVESLIHMAGSGTGTMAVNAGVMAISGYQIWRFWPSRAGKQSEHIHEEDHEHHGGGCDHVHVVPHEAMNIATAGLHKFKAIGAAAMRAVAFRGKRPESADGMRSADHLASGTPKPAPGHEKQPAPSRLRKAAGLGAMALALMGGLVSGDTSSDHTTEQSATRAPAVDDRPVIPPSKNKPQPVTECVVARAGDSQWSITEQRIEESTDTQPLASVTHAITMFTAIRNKATAPVPHAIEVGDCVHTPTRAATQILYQGLRWPMISDPRFVADLQKLSQQSDFQKALDQTAAFKRISSYVQRMATT